MRELLPMVISVILFIVTIIIIATLRKADQKNRKIEHIKKYVNHFSEKMKQSGDEIQTKVVEVESKLHEVQQDTAVAVTKIHREKEELFSHLQDLQELQSTVLQYHNVLTSLSEMTENVENRLIVVKEDINDIKKVEHLISEFSSSIEDSREAMDQMQQSLHQSFGIYQTKIETLMDSSAEQLTHSFDEKRENFTTSLDPLLVKMNAFASSLFSEVDSQVERVQYQIALLQQATSLSLSDLKQHVSESEKEHEEQQKALQNIAKESEILRSEIQKLHEEKEQVHSELAHIQEEKNTSLEELEHTSTQITSSMNELETINKDVQTSKDELLSIEDQIAEALKIKEQLEKEKEIASLLEREKVDYPTFDEEIGIDYVHSELAEDFINEQDESQEQLFEDTEEDDITLNLFGEDYEDNDLDDVYDDEPEDEIELDEEESELDEEEPELDKEIGIELDEDEDDENELDDKNLKQKYNLELYNEDYEDNDFDDVYDDDPEDELDSDREDYIELHDKDEKRKNKNIIEHNNVVHDKEEDELEISLDEDEEYI
jgi:hypothetical protein